MRRLLLLGAPGVGKGTYGKIVAKWMGVPLVTASDLLRQSSDLPQIRAAMAAGNLVPDSVVTELVASRLAKEDTADGFVLDGFPRNIAQAEELEHTLGKGPNLVLELKLKRQEYIVQKLLGRRLCSTRSCGKSFNVANVQNEEENVSMPALLPENGSTTTCDCGAPLVAREDDTEKIIKDRLAIYERETFPLANYYQAKGVLEAFTILRGLDDVPLLKDLISEKFQE